LKCDVAYQINLNAGCPSSSVTESFGAILMKTPEKTADCIRAMKKRVSIPVTLKHRVGVDDLNTYDHMKYFVSQGLSSLLFNSSLD